MIELIIVGLFLCGGVWAYRSEKKAWNNGICANTGAHWVRFDTDSQGGRGYKSGDYVTWVSWPGIDKDYNHFERKVIDGVL